MGYSFLLIRTLIDLMVFYCYEIVLIILHNTQTESLGHTNTSPLRKIQAKAIVKFI